MPEGKRRICVRDVVQAIERLAPAHLAEPWDNVGLLIGDEDSPVRTVLVALDATTETLKEARRARAHAIVTHHPLIFHPVKSLRTADPIQRLVLEFARANMALIAAHTNLDNAPGGLNDRLAEILGLRECRTLAPSGRPAERRSGLYKVAVFVPIHDWEKVRDAMADAGAGTIGNYSHCSFRVRGTGTFKPLSGASPAIGKIGEIEEVEEVRMEIIVPSAALRAVLTAMRRAHPYEEVAFDVYPLANEMEFECDAGTGRVGMLEGKIKLAALAARVRKKLRARHVRMVGDSARSIRRVAVCTGAGASLIDCAWRAGADALVTGDIKHHDALRAREVGLALVDPGHAASERHAIDILAGLLVKECPSLKVSRSTTEVEPLV